MTNVAAMPIYDKNILKRFLLPNQKADNLEALGKHYIKNLPTKNLPALILTLFMARPTLIHYAFVLEIL